MPRETSVSEVTQSDTSSIANFLAQNNYHFRHLDWDAPLSWIGKSPFYKLTCGSVLDGFLCASAEPEGSAWIRLFSARQYANYGRIFRSLFDVTKHFFQGHSPIQLAGLGLNSWFAGLLRDNDFHHLQNVISLKIDLESIPISAKSVAFVREMEPADLDIIHQIDNLSFEKIWQNSRQQIEIAYLKCQLTTVLEVDDRIAGYTMSTLNPFQAHLARIAIHPDFQDKGYGTALLQDLFQRCLTLRIGQLTLNTQDTNTRSLKLYRSNGFSPTGETLPVFAYDF